MSPQLMYNPVLSPSVEWSGHPDNCVYPEDSKGTHVTQLIYNPVLSPSVEWSGHPNNCVYPEDSSGTHVTSVDVQPSPVSLDGVEWTH
ncbi:hypothetical protein GQ457_08G027110 [Hibiscus cannabinus]